MQLLPSLARSRAVVGLMEARVVGVALFLIVRRARRLCPLLMERVVFVCFSVLCVSVVRNCGVEAATLDGILVDAATATPVCGARFAARGPAPMDVSRRPPTGPRTGDAWHA